MSNLTAYWILLALSIGTLGSLIYILRSIPKVEKGQATDWFIRCRVCKELINGDEEVEYVERYGKCRECSRC
jgi:hypothetical protein